MRLKTYFTYFHYLQVCSLYEQLVSSAHLQCSSTWTATSPGLTVRKTIFLPYVSRVQLQRALEARPSSEKGTRDHRCGKLRVGNYVTHRPASLQFQIGDSGQAPGLRVKKTLFMPYLQAVTSRKLRHWHILTVTYLC